MENAIVFLLILVLPLAVWRISNLLSDTEQAGPFNILLTIRYLAGVRFDERGNVVVKPGSFAEGILCVYCNSLWIGIAFTLLFIISKMAAFWVALPFALSAAGIIIDIKVNKMKGEYSESKDRGTDNI